MKILGICGGVACGKSRIAQTLNSWGASVLQGDPVTHEVLNYPEVIEQIFARWQGKVFPDYYRVKEFTPHHRRVIASYVFQHPEELAFLEAITGPLIVEKLRGSMKRFHPEYTPALVLDVPMLFELDLHQDCDAIWYIDAPEGQRLLNFTARYNTDFKAQYSEADLEADFKAREKRLDLPLRRSKSTAVIKNHFLGPELNFHHTVKAVKAIYEALLQR